MSTTLEKLENVRSKMVTNLTGKGVTCDTSMSLYTLIGLIPSITGDSFSADIYVSTTGSDSNAGTTRDTAVATITKAISLVSTGGTIGILNGTYTLTNTVSIDKSCIIKGQSEDGVIINGNNKSYSIKYAGTDNLTVTNCTFASNTGGIYNNSTGTVTATSCTFTSNNTGIINNSTGTVTATSCTFTSNNDGIFNSSTGTVTATNCTFTSNTRGIWNNSAGTVTATNCTFTSNRYDVYNNSGTVTLHCNTYTSGTANNYNCTEGSCP